MLPPPEPVYGSDATGMIWAFHIIPSGDARQVGSSEVAAMIAGQTPLPADQFLWLHFSLSNAGAERWMRDNLALPDGFYEGIGQSVGSTRVEQGDDSLVGVIHDVAFDFSFDASAVSTVHLCVQQGLFVSARPRPLRSIDRLREALKAGRPFRSPADLFAQLMREQANVLVEIVRKTTNRVDAIEDAILGNPRPGSRSELGTIRRMLVRLQRLLAPEPAALFRLLSRPPEWLADDDLQDLREAAEEFSAAVGDSAALVERAKLLQEELVALVAEQTNRTLFILTVVTVLALPINLFAGLFGMNVGGIPFQNHPQGFFIVVASVLLFTGTVGWIAIRRGRE